MLIEFFGEPVGKRGLLSRPGGEVEDEGKRGVGVSGSDGEEGFGEFEEEDGFASTRGAKDEEFATDFVEGGGDRFVVRDIGFLGACVESAAADGLGLGLEVEGDENIVVEGLLEDGIDPCVADVVEDGLALALFFRDLGELGGGVGELVVCGALD